MTFGMRVRELRRERGLTLRALAEASRVDRTYLSKIENDRSGFRPGAETVRAIATALQVDVLEMLMLAQKVPPELEHIVATASGRRFYLRSKAITSSEEWDALSDLLERKLRERVAVSDLPGPGISRGENRES